MTTEHRTCRTCLDYAFARVPVLMPALVARRRETGETSEQILDRYMRGVHARHLDGLPIMPSAAA